MLRDTRYTNSNGVRVGWVFETGSGKIVKYDMMEQ
jgi:hypothetical protein